MSNTGDGATLYDTTRKPSVVKRLRVEAQEYDAPAPDIAARYRLLADLLDEAKKHVTPRGQSAWSGCIACADLIHRAGEEIA